MNGKLLVDVLIAALDAASGIPTVLEKIGNVIGVLRQQKAFTPEEDAALDAKMEAGFASPAWQLDPADVTNNGPAPVGGSPMSSPAPPPKSAC